MPRRARIVAVGYPMHVILRGIDRTAIFFDDSDYRSFLDYLCGSAHVDTWKGSPGRPRKRDDDDGQGQLRI